MRKKLVSVLALAAAMAFTGPAAAEPWKSGSVHLAHGGPPPWAPAHGYRAKAAAQHKHRKEHRDPYLQVQVSRDPTIVIQGGKCNREAAGAVLGGIAGGIIGHRIGRDSGNEELGTIAGAVIGVVVGQSIGREMDNSDASCAAHTLQHAADGHTVAWHNPRTGVQYRLTPTRTFKRDGLHCRRYISEVAGGKKSARGQSEACRLPDGTWQFVEKRRR